MNINNNQTYYSQQHKKRGHCNSFDSEMPPLGLPRKKFVSEESFAKDMAAMSLLENNNTSIAQQQNLLDHDRYHVGVDSILHEEQEYNHMMSIDTNGNTLIDVDRNGLPMELKPGENKLRIPDFILKNTELTDPRDIQAYENIMKSLSSNHKQTHIEVLNNPSEHYAPTSMDID